MLLVRKASKNFYPLLCRCALTSPDEVGVFYSYKHTMKEYKAISIDEIVEGRPYYVKYQGKGELLPSMVLAQDIDTKNQAGWFNSDKLYCPFSVIICLYPVLSIDEASMAINAKPMDEHEEYEKYKAVWFDAFKRVNAVAPGIGSWGFGKSSEITRREARKGAKHIVSEGIISETDYKLAVLGEKEAVKWLREQEK